MPWSSEYESALPSLPAWVHLPTSQSRTAQALQSELADFLAGCWQIRLRPIPSDDVVRTHRHSVGYEGTLRFEAEGAEFRASGDLYLRHGSEPVRETEVPVFPIECYRFYLRLTAIELDGSELRLTLGSYRFEHSTKTWSSHGALTTRFPLKSLSSPRLATERVLNESGTKVFRARMERVSDSLREAAVEIDKVPLIDWPPALDWAENLKTIFASVGWKLHVFQRKGDVDEPNGAVWSGRGLHEHMLGWKDDLLRRQEEVGFPSRWTFHLLIVRRLTSDLFQRYGLMYDARGIDSDQVPREGVAVAHQARFPCDQPERFGNAGGRILGKVPRALLWTAAHELSHAMGLAHNFQGLGLMQGLYFIADELKRRRDEVPDGETAPADLQFPDGIGFFFDPEDAARLRHAPDVWVRPGGQPFLHNFAFEPIPLADLTREEPNLHLELQPLSDVLPLGAPLRLELKLENRSPNGTAHAAPKSLSLKSGCVSGRVVTPSGVKKVFATAVRYSGEGTMLLGGRTRGKKRRKSLTHSMTLLRGPDGALLASPGTYRVEVEIAWEQPGAGRTAVSAAASVLVTAPADKDQDHALAALKILSDPDVMLPLIFRTGPDPRGDVRTESSESESAFLTVLRNPLLAPHFWVLLAKKLAAGDLLGETATIIGKVVRKGLVMTETETSQLVEVLEQALASEDVRDRIKEYVLGGIAESLEENPANLAEILKRALDYKAVKATTKDLVVQLIVNFLGKEAPVSEALASRLFEILVKALDNGAVLEATKEAAVETLERILASEDVPNGIKDLVLRRIAENLDKSPAPLAEILDWALDHRGVPRETKDLIVWLIVNRLAKKPPVSEPLASRLAEMLLKALDNEDVSDEAKEAAKAILQRMGSTGSVGMAAAAAAL